MIGLEYGRGLLFKLNHIPLSNPDTGGSNHNGIVSANFPNIKKSRQIRSTLTIKQKLLIGTMSDC